MLSIFVSSCSATVVSYGAKFKNSRNGLILKAIQKSLNHSTYWPCINVKSLLVVRKICILAYIETHLLFISEKGKGSRMQGNISLIISKILRKLVTQFNLKRLIIVCFPKQINVSYQIQLSYRSTNHAF